MLMWKPETFSRRLKTLETQKILQNLSVNQMKICRNQDVIGAIHLRGVV